MVQKILFKIFWIFYYFNNVIKPTVKQNSTTKNVPVLYGSPERWKAVQSDGYYRDRHGKIQLPLILIKREGIEKNRNLGNKIDANNPLNFQVINKKYSDSNKSIAKEYNLDLDKYNYPL